MSEFDAEKLLRITVGTLFTATVDGEFRQAYQANFADHLELAAGGKIVAKTGYGFSTNEAIGDLVRTRGRSLGIVVF